MAKKRNRGEPDPLSVQVYFRVRVPRGSQVTRKALNEIYLDWIRSGELPPGIEIRGIFWRNPARHGELADWRFSKGSDTDVLKPHGAGVELSPRGSHEDARETLRGALLKLRPF